MGRVVGGWLPEARRAGCLNQPRGQTEGAGTLHSEAGPRKQGYAACRWSHKHASGFADLGPQPLGAKGSPLFGSPLFQRPCKVCTCQGRTCISVQGPSPPQLCTVKVEPNGEWVDGDSGKHLAPRVSGGIFSFGFSVLSY